MTICMVFWLLVTPCVRAQLLLHDTPIATTAMDEDIHFALQRMQEQIVIPQDTDDAEADNHPWGREACLILAPCATGHFNADELWGAYQDSVDLEIHFWNHVRMFRQAHPPCLTFLEALYDRTHKSNRLVPLAYVEDYSDSSKNEVERTVVRGSRVLVRQGVSIPIVLEEPADGSHGDQEQTLEDKCRLEVFFTQVLFDFVCLLDATDDVAARGQYRVVPAKALGEISKEWRLEPWLQAPRSQLSSQIRLHLLQLLDEERGLLSLWPSGSIEATWQSSFSLDDWDLLRQKTPSIDRSMIAGGWITLSQMVLVKTNNASLSIDCLRRAVAWFPGHVATFLTLSSLLEGLGRRNASCRMMEKMIELANPAEHGANDIRRALTTHFAHCNAMIRATDMWQSSSLVQCTIAIGLTITLAHGLVIALHLMRTKWRDSTYHGKHIEENLKSG